MRCVWLGSLVFLSIPAGWTFAQSPGPDALPPRPVPVAVPFHDPPPPVTAPADTPLTPLPPPTPLPSLPPAPPLPPPPLPDACLDGFATRFWVTADYLLWWTKPNQLPALVTSGSPTDAVPGALGQPGTQVLFGGDIDNRVRSGGRFRAGYWFTPDQTFGIDGTFFFLGGQAAHFDAASHGIPLLARPFFNVNTNQEDAFLVAFPGKQAGEIRASLNSTLWGADPNLRGMLFRGPTYQVSLLGGFRFLDLREGLRIKEMDTLFPASFSDPLTWTTVVDHFHTSNQFYGGQIGTDVMWCRGRFFVNVLAKVALGTSVEEASINGCSSFTTSNGQSGKIGVGEFALPSNLGRYGKDQFAVVPEFGLNLGYALTQHLRLTIGYTFLYWSSVFRPGDQIDRVLNTTEFPALVGSGSMFGPPRPNFTFKDTDFWAQGLNFGLQFRY